MTTRAWSAVRRATALVAVAGVLAACHASRLGLPVHSPLPSQSAVAHEPSSAASEPAATPPTTAAPDPRTVAARRLTAIAAHLSAGSISVAVLDTQTGASFRWGERGGMWTGSVYKLLVLETLLLQRQRAGTWFADYELDDITAMMEQSRNRAGYRMYLDAGGASPVMAAAHRLGLRHTHLGSTDPALTVSDARDGIALLRPLVTAGPLDARSRAFVLHLMRNVQADQRWGVGVVADRGTTSANKNGWMRVRNNNGPGENDDSRWLVNSLGIVRVHGHRLLMAIFTRHNPDCYTGIDLVEELARVVAPAVAAPGGRR
jgi:hypothetical protein